MAREATVGPQIYARVNELLASGEAAKNSEAFRIVAREMEGDGASAEDLTKRERSVATNYYRLQRLAQTEGTAVPVAKPKPVEPVAVTAEEEITVPTPKKRGRPKGSKNKSKVEASVPAAGTVQNGKQNGYAPDLLSALAQAKEAIDRAAEQARTDAAELAELREFRDKAKTVLG